MSPRKEGKNFLSRKSFIYREIEREQEQEELKLEKQRLDLEKIEREEKWREWMR